MAEDAGTMTVAGLGDLHVGDDDVHPYRQLFTEISGEADVLALCGDLTNFGTVREAEILAEDLRNCRIPVVGVLGNHDVEAGHQHEVVRILQQAGLRYLEEHAHMIGGVGFAGVKGFAGGFGSRTLGAFGEPAIKQFVAEAMNEAMRLENALRTLRTNRIVTVLHYAPISATVEGEPPEIYPFLGSSRLADALDRFEVAAVLHGHAHHGTYSGKTLRGIPVYNCALKVPKDSGKPYALIKV